MFAPPPELEAEPFAVLPDSLKRNGRDSEWTFGKMNPDMGSFLEGICCDRNGQLLVTDVPFGRVFRVGDDGSFETVAEFDGEPNGMTIHSDGTIYIADHRRGLVTVDPARDGTPSFCPASVARDSRDSTTRFSTAGGTSISPIRDRRACRIRLAGSTAARRTAEWTCWSTPCRARTAWPSARTSGRSKSP